MTGNWRRVLYGCTIFTSALLLFLVQPMIAKAILPWFGGSAGVWTTSMLFFQALLLAGYWYAHGVVRLNRRMQGMLHAGLLAASLALLPVLPDARWKPAPGADPAGGILLLLAATVGLPYFLLSATSPLLQSWYAREPEGRSPYRLFAVSNLASLAALVAYPVAVEPVLPLRAQLLTWSGAYAGFAVICGLSALASTARKPLLVKRHAASRSDKLVWILLAACPSAMWLAVANQMSQNVAPMPFLWILPLSIYLLTLILCFDRDGLYNPRVFMWLLPLGLFAMAFALTQQAGSMAMRWILPLFGGGLFVCAMFCHGELARRKPAAEQLTSFYLMVAAGGAAGGAFVALAAPRVLSVYFELQISMIACLILALALLYGYSRPAHLARLGLTALVGCSIALYLKGSLGQSVVTARNFYGALEVADGRGPFGLRVLYHGSIIHGTQYLAPERSRTPTGYYGEASGAALALRHRAGRAGRVGVIGLGAGTLAAFGRKGDTYRFYEINPQVIQIARKSFRYLAESEAQIEVVEGDARLSMEREPPQNYDVLLVDAFSGDSIPVHLLTREAFRLYFRDLGPGGILGIHVTNKYLDLAPVVIAVAKDLGYRALPVRSNGDGGGAIYGATWVLMSSDPDVQKVLETAADRTPGRRILRAWTDDYSNLFRVLR